ncbi:MULTISPECIES: hypothetical protein [Bradyrhizobium]|uniref:hypothetical protein n=1 Tax=Bradyrhizobium TaxID=374 RepID=UPI0004B2EB8E|nr:hypothetical protein [Bradyrhizobium elkanii]MCP1972918.1 hypothetical protein [Bradyrhizobium elkanii]MCS3520115.1 hypothetical protein [Bradyrhizobium elkanii]MCS4067770.1 hypothetical protein [Bradyrhizobium elkanii]MCS4083306.1 hypothetical protein [Bradyrhizobium elkanii]MCS4105574.1 hypothetical protein [Bradyrhizobium elkanii]
MSLNFERAGRVEVTLEVVSVGAKGPRLQIVSGDPAPLTVLVAKAVPHGEPFFTLICGTRVMADVTVTPGRSGPVEIDVKLKDGDEKPLAVDALSVCLSNPDKHIALVKATAERIAADSWRVRMTAAVDGKWSLSLGIDMTKEDRIDIAAPIRVMGNPSNWQLCHRHAGKAVRRRQRDRAMAEHPRVG